MIEGSFQGLAGPEVELFKEHLWRVEGEGLEIGCCDGYSSVIILQASCLSTLYSVDPLIPDSMEKSLCGSEERLRANLKPFERRHDFFRNTSLEASEFLIKDFDFCFIDGDHSYQSAMQDFNLWTPRLKKGGLLAMHDCRMNRPNGATFHKGPSQVADERVFSYPEEWEVIGEAFSLMIARKL